MEVNMDITTTNANMDMTITQQKNQLKMIK